MDTHASEKRTPAFALILGALGVVFGDIGTSPLYAFQAVFGGAEHAPLIPTEPHVYGILSLILWSVTIVVSIKYIGFMLRADNDGEGGVLALASLIRLRIFQQFHGNKVTDASTTQMLTIPQSRSKRRLVSIVGFIGILAAGLFYGDSMITPAISIMSAVEGLAVANPSFESLVVPIGAAILLALFGVQRWGTGAMGKAFGPVMVLWFLTLAGLGLISVLRNPAILWALSPHHAFAFMIDSPLHAFFAMGAVVLSVTGAEALYADMGHFGREPIVRAWAFLVFPCLVINYLGQGALVLRDPSAVSNPFFLLVPEILRYPVVILATLATVIASQAVISGAYSVSVQAQRSGYLPRLRTVHTSEHRGQIYVPAINWLLCVGSVTLLLGFKSSENLSGAYGLAVSASFLLSTTLLAIYLLNVRGWTWKTVGPLVAFFLVGELVLFAATAVKIFTGGWVPLTIASLTMALMITWMQGLRLLASRRAEITGTWKKFEERTDVSKLARVPGAAVYMHQSLDTIPLALLTNVRMNRALHETIVVAQVKMMPVPRVAPEKRLSVRHEIHGIKIVLVRINFGFLETADVPRALRKLGVQHGCVKLKNPWYIVARVAMVPGSERHSDGPMGGLARWQKGIFMFLFRNQARAATSFHLPVARTVGVETELRL